MKTNKGTVLTTKNIDFKSKNFSLHNLNCLKQSNQFIFLLST